MRADTLPAPFRLPEGKGPVWSLLHCGSMIDTSSVLQHSTARSTRHQGTFTSLDSVSVAPRLSFTVRTTV
jgi:hypothetical protein